MVEAEAARPIETSARRIKEVLRFTVMFFLWWQEAIERWGFAIETPGSAKVVNRWTDKKSSKKHVGGYRNYSSNDADAGDSGAVCDH